MEEYDQECPASKDGRGHCMCWWDGDDCCWCGAPAMTEEAKLEAGMIEPGEEGNDGNG
jgi:hypothetical protein